MRVWLDPDRLQSLGLTATDVMAALQGQNIQVASGVLDQPPVNRAAGAFQIAVQTLGRLADPDEFGSIVVKQTPAPWCGSRTSPGSSSRRRIIRRIPISITIPRSRSPFSSGRARTRWRPPRASSTPDGPLSKRFPVRRQIRHRLQSDPVHPAIGRRGDRDHRRGHRARRAGGDRVPADLARRDHSAGRHPGVAGRHVFLHGAFGFTLNNLSLFGLVLAIGIVVDDAIVVVENVERNIATGLAPREAAQRAWTRSARR
jgi:hypothetical protein